MFEEVFDLKQSSAATGLKIERLRQMVISGEIEGIQPGGPGGKLFIPARELERLRTPVSARAK